jgi:hypothetical protein
MPADSLALVEVIEKELSIGERNSCMNSLKPVG